MTGETFVTGMRPITTPCGVSTTVDVPADGVDRDFEAVFAVTEATLAGRPRHDS
ncbi:hypothetical protein GCM10028815_14350 [Mariniluteicoccus flavus]